MFYTFRQNNSGGSFDRDADIDEVVIIEADSEDQANNKAEDIGIYFYGVRSGRDCECCGDRWTPYYGGATNDPEIYGEIAQTTSYDYKIHYKDGRIESNA